LGLLFLQLLLYELCLLTSGQLTLEPRIAITVRSLT